MLPVYLKTMPSITLELVWSTSEANSDWMHDIVKYLQIGELPEDMKQAHRLRI